MRSITIHGLSIQFDADQETSGTDRQQAAQAIDLINDILQREPYGLAAQILSLDQLDVDSEEIAGTTDEDEEMRRE